jgi:hypothetical protein
MYKDMQFPIDTDGRSGAVRAQGEAHAVCFIRLSIPTEVAFEQLALSCGLDHTLLAPLRVHVHDEDLANSFLHQDLRNAGNCRFC